MNFWGCFLCAFAYANIGHLKVNVKVSAVYWAKYCITVTAYAVQLAKNCIFLII
jgi:hypothetical protein